MNRKQLIIMGLAMGLPSSIIGLFFFLNYLVNSGYISYPIMLIILVSVISYTLYLMMTYDSKKKN